MLNPAFKRFQYLPHPPSGGPGKHACAAPHAAEGHRTDERNAPDRSLDHRSSLSVSQTRQEHSLSGPACEFQTPA